MDAGRPASTPSSATTAADKFMLTQYRRQFDRSDQAKRHDARPDDAEHQPERQRQQYVLTADAGVNLAAHVNHRCALPASSARWATIR